MWEVTYEDGSIEQFEDMGIELVCAYINEKKTVIKIERMKKITDE